MGRQNLCSVGLRLQAASALLVSGLVLLRAKQRGETNTRAQVLGTENNVEEEEGEAGKRRSERQKRGI